MKAILDFCKAFAVFIQMYRYGLYFSSNVHANRTGGHWGVYRFNHTQTPALFDVVFDFDKQGYGYYHVRGDNCRQVVHRQIKSR